VVSHSREGPKKDYSGPCCRKRGGGERAKSLSRARIVFRIGKGNLTVVEEQRPKSITIGGGTVHQKRRRRVKGGD